MASLNERLSKINEELHEKEVKNAQYSNQIKQEFDETIAKLHSELTRLKNDLSRAKRDQADFAHYYDLEKEKLNKLTNDKNNWDSHLKKLKDEIDLLEKQTLLLQENIFSHFPAEKQLLMRYRTLKQGSHALVV